MGLPRTIDGRFVLDAEAAAGGMGTVYRGHDVATGAPLAIKVLHRTGTGDHERFLREVAILAGLVHPGVVRYVAHGILDGGAPYLVMEWIDGETLDARLAAGGLSIADTVLVAGRVALALAFAHARGVVHRDIKPSNLIFPGGDLARATVLDFGVARTVSRAGSLTETGSVIGTPSYMAPEQVRGERDVGPAADVFALGCVLYECLTGRLAFEGFRFLALRAKILLWDPPPVREQSPEVPLELDALVRRMLAKAPAMRPPDGAALVAELAALPATAAGVVTRRPRRTDPPTLIDRPSHGHVTGSPRMFSIVIATSLEGMDEGDAAPTVVDLDAPTVATTLSPSLESDVRGHGGELDVLHSGALLVTLVGHAEPRAQAVRAIACARAVRRALPDALVGVATCLARGSDEAAAIDEAVAALARDAMHVVFAGVGGRPLPPGAIRVDARTAALVAPEVALVEVGDAYYLPGPAC